MLSIDNTYSIDELNEYRERTEKLLDPTEAIEWIVELKIDGAAASVFYEQGVLSMAVTRGNGKVGDNVTHNIRTIPDLPLKLSGKPNSQMCWRCAVRFTCSIQTSPS